MAIIQGNAKKSSVSGFYPKTIEGSLRFNDDDSAYLSWTPTGTTGGRTKFTYSGWVKISALSTANGFHLLNAPYASNLNGSLLMIDSNNEFYAQFRVYTTGSQGTFDAECYSNMKFRDSSAWYHIVFTYDSTAAETSRMKLWVNGVSQSFRSVDWPGSSTAQYIGSEFAHQIGRWLGSSHGNTDGYLAEVHFTDGTAYTADAFGELKNGVWVAKTPDVTYGTNGFYLDFQDDTEVEAFNTVLWRGNGTSQSITGVGFQPDLVWVKGRSVSRNHSLSDTVRGTNKDLMSNSTSAELSDPSITSFNSDGFTVGAEAKTNNNGENYVAWCWDAGANNVVTGHSSVTWTGNGSSSGQVISGLPFKPDLIWYKTRNNSYDHKIFDSVRGASNRLSSNSTAAEVSFNELKDFLPGGFSFANGDASKGNGSGENMIAWAWDAGDGDPVSNTDGSITSTVKASTTNGFSIVSWTGTGSLATVGHGLSSAPSMIIIKNRTDNEVWRVFHTSAGATVGLKLNDTSNDVDNTNTGIFNDTAPTSSVFTVNTFNSANGSGDLMIAYCFHDVTGKQKFDTYTGDGTTDGSLEINVGFRPGWLMIKRTDSAHDWSIIDASRSPFNPTTKELLANTSDAEGIAQRVNFTDTGFQLVNSGGRVNANGGTYIYAAFAGSYSDFITDYNTDGSIDSRVKANDTTGFSIVSYNGSTGIETVGHGLSATPDFVIVKDRTNSVTYPAWWTWHSSLGTDAHVFLNSTDGGSGSGYFDTSGMSSSTIGFLSDVSGPNTTGESYIAYCWAEKSGYSKFGSYVGSSGDPSVTTGFKPAFVLIKRIDASGNSWSIWDNTRDTDGDGNLDLPLFPNLSNAEDTSSYTDYVQFTDTGFVVKGNGAFVNGGTSSYEYIYAAFADTREAAFWLDQSGNDNDWQPVNLDHNDTLLDSPTNNFATINVLKADGAGGYGVLDYSSYVADGNLRITGSGNSDGQYESTIKVTSGKYYAEVTNISGDRNIIGIGFYPSGMQFNAATVTYFTSAGQIQVNASVTDTVTAVSSTSDVVGIALNADDQEVSFYLNGTLLATKSFSTSNPIGFFGNAYKSVTAATALWNFGQQPFKYDPPA